MVFSLLALTIGKGIYILLMSALFLPTVAAVKSSKIRETDKIFMV